MALATFDLLEAVALRGNPNSTSDAGVGALCANTAVHGAALNVRINLPGLEDEDYKKEKYAGVKEITAEADKRLKEIMDIVNEKLEAQSSN
jgi:glutamate formiminotransferase/formiminotetrahydrofolate cyclodeaminase